MELESEASSAVAACREAGALLRGFFERGDTATRSKAVRQDVVTEADLESERLILEQLRAAWPDDGFLAEESGRSNVAGKRVWCVDPLDGTANFAAGYPHWAVAIALLEGKEPVLAVTYDPLREEIFVARSGDETTSSAGPVGMRRVLQVEDALVADNRPYDHREPAHPLEMSLRLSRGRRESGSMALDFAWLAIGRLDAVAYERSERLWDYIGGELLVRSAGGAVGLADIERDIAVAACPELAELLCTAKTSRDDGTEG